MKSIRALLRRVERLQQARVGHVARMVGPIDEFEAETKAGINAGRYDPNDMPIVVIAIKQWIESGL